MWNSETKRGRMKLAAGKPLRSRVWPSTRSNMIATVRRGASLPFIEATVHGSRNSALQPSAVSVTRCFQSPSQSVLKAFSLVIVASCTACDSAIVKL